MTEVTAKSLYELIIRECKGRNPNPFLAAAEQFPPGTRWVMDLDNYKQVRAACQAAGAVYPEDDDPGNWVPKPEDQLYGLPVEVREDGGTPHLETPSHG